MKYRLLESALKRLWATEAATDNVCLLSFLPTPASLGLGSPDQRRLAGSHHSLSCAGLAEMCPGQALGRKEIPHMIQHNPPFLPS